MQFLHAKNEESNNLFFQDWERLDSNSTFSTNPQNDILFVRTILRKPVQFYIHSRTFLLRKLSPFKSPSHFSENLTLSTSSSLCRQESEESKQSPSKPLLVGNWAVFDFKFTFSQTDPEVIGVFWNSFEKVLQSIFLLSSLSLSNSLPLLRKPYHTFTVCSRNTRSQTISFQRRFSFQSENVSISISLSQQIHRGFFVRTMFEKASPVLLLSSNISSEETISFQISIHFSETVHQTIAMVTNTKTEETKQSPFKPLLVGHWVCFSEFSPAHSYLSRSLRKSIHSHAKNIFLKSYLLSHSHSLLCKFTIINSIFDRSKEKSTIFLPRHFYLGIE